ncbi:MAG: hypothetical protein AAF541_16450 [Pseudomonadota bacterium]
MSEKTIGKTLERVKWLALLALPLVPLSTNAAWVVEPSANLQTRYDDNVRSQQVNEENGLVTTIGGQARLRNIQEASEVSILAGVNLTKYSGVDSFDNDERESFFFDGRALRRFERSQIRVGASYRRQDLLRFFRVLDADDVSAAPEEIAEEDLLEEPDVGDDLLTDVEVDVGSTEFLVQRDRVNISPQFSYSVSPRSSVALNLGYYEVSYDDPSPVSSFQDSESRSVGVAYQHQLSPRTTVSVEVDAQEFEPEQGLEADSYSLTASWQSALTERLRLSIAVGARRTETDFFDDTGMIFNGRLTRQFENGTLFTTLARTLSASGFGDQVESDRITVGYRRNLNDRLSWRVDVRAFQTETLSRFQQDNTRDFVRVETSLQYRYSRDWRTSLGFRHSWIDRSTEQDDVTSNAVTLSVEYVPPRR